MNLKPGQKFCRHCYEHVANNDNLNKEDVLQDLDASFYDYTLETKESSFDADAIVCHQLKKYLSGTKFHMVETN